MVSQWSGRQGITQTLQIQCKCVCVIKKKKSNSLHAACPRSLVFRGFCYFNSVAIAAKQLQHKLSVSKILIVDWVRAAIPLSFDSF